MESDGNLFYLAAIVFSAGMMALDAWQTRRAIQRLGMVEINPIMIRIMERFGVTGGLVLTKTVLLSVAFLASAYVLDQGGPVWGVAGILAAPGFIHLFPAAWNWLKIRR